MENSNSSKEEQRFRVRKLELSDRRKGFIELLQKFTVCGSASGKEFEDRFKEISMYGDDHVVCVVKDELSGKIIATGSVFVEKKFIRNCCKVGHIEDVAVDGNARGMQLGKKIMGFLSDHAIGVIRLFWIAVLIPRCFMRSVVLSRRKFRWSSTLFECNAFIYNAYFNY